jgi:hypothetical protein
VSHRAALYTVRVKQTPSKDDYKDLGDYNGHGAFVGDTLAKYLENLAVPNQDGTKLVVCESVTPAGEDGEELHLKLRHGENGVAAIISDDQGQERYRQRATDTQLLSCGGLFVLPRHQNRGWLALHVNANRGVKGLLGLGLLQAFAGDHDKLRLQLDPYVEKSILETAVAKGKVNTVRLLKSVPPNDRADAITSRWLPKEHWGKIEVQIRPKGRAEHVKAALLKKYVGGGLDDKRQAFPEIVEFNGMTFDEAKIEVELENKTVRTFNIEKPESGHPLTVDLDPNDIGLDKEGEPDHDKLVKALRAALNAVL